jgi:hypothetical protein
LPTTAARKDAKIILASAPWGDSGAFHSWMMAGLAGDDADIAARSWALQDARWISPSYIAAMKRILPPLRFRAEVLGEWVGAGDAFFAREDILACVAGFPMVRDGNGAPAVIGLDWGRQRDRHAVAVVSLLQDYGVNGRPVAIVAWVETSRREYDGQFAEVASLAECWQSVIWSEENGPGGPATELLARQVTTAPVRGSWSGQRDKEAAYAKLNMLLEQRAIVLPNELELLRQLGGVSASPTMSGGIRIEARLESIHDDLPDALSLAVAHLPAQLPPVPERPVPEGVSWAETTGGVKVPVPFVTLRPEASYADYCGGMWRCPVCPASVPAYRRECTTPGCTGTNPDYDPAAPPPAAVADSMPAKPDGGAGQERRAAWDPDLWYCANGHAYLKRYHDSCPKCQPGTAGHRPGGMPGAPDAFRRALQIGPRR